MAPSWPWRRRCGEPRRVGLRPLGMRAILGAEVVPVIVPPGGNNSGAPRA